ncbi:glycosyl transferase [Pilimelia terevasa]|uniref:Glycosyl transferase n=1 Tax=Pilimelia terevasa TaxID=53372 RepID=A0A8J3FKC7_9ACTN|nr:glycosyltransferase family A protein [Pilimelia terevasa]GGK32693.1 glycosyl transferase [Pilimelia terevasa]
MSTAGRVSVVVPTRDRPTLLRAALAALRAQHHPGGVEVLVVFDQSAPDAALAGGDDRYRVRVLGNDRTPGLAGARNTGILAATGDLVAFCDDDDVWLPGKLAAQTAALAADPGAELVCTGIRVRYADHTTDRTLADTRVPLAALLRDRLTTLHPSTFLFRRDALVDGIGLVDETIPGSYAEDYELLLRAARRTPVRNLPTPLVEVRWHAQSFFTARWRTISAALRWLLDRYPEFDSVPRGTARLRGQIAFAEAAAGNRRAALRWAARTVRAAAAEPRAYLALAVASGVVGPDRLLRLLHRRGRGI